MLNFDVTKKCLVGEGWCPTFAKTQVYYNVVTLLHTRLSFRCKCNSSTTYVQIHEVLQRATFDSNSQVGVIFHVMQAVESPPTYFRTNKLTNAFQEIIDAYGLVPLLTITSSLRCKFLFLCFPHHTYMILE